MAEEKINVNFEVSSNIRGVPTCVFMNNLADIAHEKLDESCLEMKGLDEDIDLFVKKYPDAEEDFMHIIRMLRDNIESLEGGYCSILDRLGD